MLLTVNMGKCYGNCECSCPLCGQLSCRYSKDCMSYRPNIVWSNDDEQCSCCANSIKRIKEYVEKRNIELDIDEIRNIISIIRRNNTRP